MPMVETISPVLTDPLLAALPRVDGKPLLGNVVLESRIGRGAMSHVFYGHHQQYQIPVVVKMMRQGEDTDPHAWDRFLREGSVGARIRHPNIIRVLDYDHHDGQGYLVMEFVQGVTLGHCIFRTPLRERRALEIMTPIAMGLAAIWRDGYLHADVKPDNILVPVEDTHPRLLDLGFARPIGEKDPLLQDRMTAGTPYYMSPEAARGEPCLEIQSDMYSFGATLYHALTGAVPIEGDSEEEVMHALQRRNPVPPLARNRDLTEETSNFVLRLLEKNPDHRYPLSEFLLSLRHLGAMHP